MGNTLLSMEAANMYCGTQPGVNGQNSLHLELAEVKMPALNEQYVDHRAGGTPMTIEIDTIFAKPEITFQLLGWDTQVQELIGSWSQDQNKFWIYGLVRDRNSGAAIQSICQVKGRLGLSDPQNFRRGEAMHWNYAVKGIVHYELFLANERIYFWDFFTNTFVVGTADRNAELNRALLISTGQQPGTVVGATVGV